MASARLAIERAIELIDNGKVDEARAVLKEELGRQSSPQSTTAAKKPILLSPKSLMSKRISISRAGAGLAAPKPLQPAPAPIPASRGRVLGQKEQDEAEDFFGADSIGGELLSRRSPEPEVPPLDAEQHWGAATEPIVIVEEPPASKKDSTVSTEEAEILSGDSDETPAVEVKVACEDDSISRIEDEEEEDAPSPDSKEYWKRRGTAEVVTASIDQHLGDHTSRSKSRLSMTVTNPLAGSDEDLQVHKMYNNALKELLGTEKDYVRDLHIIISSYKEPMERAGLITKKESQTIFSNVGQLVGLHVELLAQMNAVMNRRRKQELALAAQAAEAEEEAPGVVKPISPPPEKGGLKVLIRVLLSKENANKTLVVTKKTLGKEALAQALNKHLSRLPTEEEKARLRDYYSECEIVHVPAGSSSDTNPGEVLIETEEPMLPQIVYQLGDDLPQFVIRRSTVKPSIGHCFLELATYLKMYSEYCSGQVASMSLVYEMRNKNKKVAAFLSETLKDEHIRGLDISAFLILPLQRVCKYPLLLRELLKHTPVGHEDHDSLVEAVTAIGEQVALVNEKKREAESQEEMVRIQHNIDAPGEEFSLLSADRRFIGQGEVRLIASRKGVEPCPNAWYFLMNDMFVVTKAADEAGRFTFLDKAMIIDCFLMPSPDAPTEVEVKLPGREEPLLRLGFSSEEAQSSFTKLMRATILETRREAYDIWTVIQQKKGFVTNKSFEEWLSTFFVA